MKPDLIEGLSQLLLKNKFLVGLLGPNSHLDIIARNKDKAILIKVLGDANSIRKESADDIGKIASYVNSTPIIIAEKAGLPLEDNIVYARFGIYTVNLKTFENFINNNRIFIKSTKAGLTASLSVTKLKNRLDKGNISMRTLSKKIGVSARMVWKYENDDSEITLQKALKIYELFGDVFNEINLFSFDNSLFSDVSTDISRKYSSLGFSTAEIKKSLFDVVAKKGKEIILTKVGDDFDKNLTYFSKMLDVEDLVIFENKRPKDVASIKKDEFLELDRADELIKVVKEF